MPLASVLQIWYNISENLTWVGDSLETFVVLHWVSWHCLVLLLAGKLCWQTAESNLFSCIFFLCVFYVASVSYKGKWAGNTAVTLPNKWLLSRFTEQALWWHFFHGTDLKISNYFIYILISYNKIQLKRVWKEKVILSTFFSVQLLDLEHSPIFKQMQKAANSLFSHWTAGFIDFFMFLLIAYTPKSTISVVRKSCWACSFSQIKSLMHCAVQIALHWNLQSCQI